MTTSNESQTPNILPEGTYTAVPKYWGPGVTKNGTEQFGITFEISEGPFKGGRASWFGFLNTRDNAARAVKVLNTCGWDSTSSLGDVQGLTETVELVVHHEQYNGKTSAKIAFVNRLGLRMRPMPTEKIKTLDGMLAMWGLASTPRSSPAMARETTTAATIALENDDDIPF